MYASTSQLPFNFESFEGRFVPGNSTAAPSDREGRWFLVQNQSIFLLEGRKGVDQIPLGQIPEAFEGRVESIVYFGNYLGTPCWAGSVVATLELPAGFVCERLAPGQIQLSDDLLSLCGLAQQATTWEATSWHCPRCGEPAVSIRGERGKRCLRCKFDHYPHLHPAVIVLIRDGDRILLTRKSFWSKGRYGLVAGFLDIGESLEAGVRREIHEEVGVQVRDIRYVGSQYWPFPSQIMIGFVATYAGGEIRVDHSELEDARWFSVHELPEIPGQHSIARFILDHYARPEEAGNPAIGQSGN
ncbi:MAG: NAD(+) diphosphatase [candidate division NC10 bacterium]|nr:NAD(+) diphosphatase [candidate division NC10 bacterium]